MFVSSFIGSAGLNSHRLKNTGLFRSINAAASGLTAESFRMDVISNNIANLQITYSGEGIIQEAEKPGIFTRFFNWLF